MIRFIHTADWQIGKPFAAMKEVAAQLRAARLDAIDALAAQARARGIVHVLVAGDVYDGENLARPTMLAPLERMRQATGIRWWLIPGNHDPHRAGGIWERVIAGGLPDNVRFCGVTEPLEMEAGVWLLPAPLMAKHTARDSTDWMDTAETPAGSIRIGLAHGSIRDFGQRQESPNVIDPARVGSARLDWLALGDWHGIKRIGPRIWYPGTPEPDAFREARTGRALSVSIAGAGALPDVEEITTGHHDWQEIEVQLSDSASITDLADRLGSEVGSRSIVRLKLIGAVSPGDLARLDHVRDVLAARVCHLDEVRDRLGLALDDGALASLHLAGVLGSVAAGLRETMEQGGPDANTARDALMELYTRAGGA